MTQTLPRWSERGQATVEHVGLTLIIVLMLAATAMWVAREVRPPDRLPDVIGQLVAPLTDADGPALLPVPAGSPVDHLQVPMERRGQPGLFQQLRNGAIAWGVANVDGQLQALGGFTDQIKSVVGGLVSDPVGNAVRVIVPLRVGTSATASDLGEQSWAGYLYDVGKRPWRDTFMTVSRNAGRWAADWLILRGAKFLRLQARGAIGMPRP